MRLFGLLMAAYVRGPLCDVDGVEYGVAFGEENLDYRSAKVPLAMCGERSCGDVWSRGNR